MSDSPHVRVGLLVNPTSRREFVGCDGIYAAHCLHTLGFDVVDLTVRSAEKAACMDSAAVASGRFDALFAVGDNGTVGMAADALADSRIPLGTFTIGTGNDVARHSELPRYDVDAILAPALDTFESERTFAAGILEVAPETGGRRVMPVIPAGLNTNVDRRTNSLSFPHRGMRYMREIVSVVANFAPYGFRLEIDGRIYSAPVTLVSVVNTHFFGTGLSIAPSVTVADELADVIFTAGLSHLQIIGPPHRLALGHHSDHPLIHFARVRRVRIACESRAGARPPDPMVDGDRLGILPIDVTRLLGAVEVLI